MSFNDKVIKLYKNPWIIALYLGHKGYLNWLPDDLYLKLIYRAKMGKKLDLKNPITFNEKLQWLKINDRNPLYTKLADKYEVREYIKEKIGEQYLIPILGVYDSFEDIDFSILPSQFVLKTTHDSGGVVICRDKKNFNINYAKEKLNKSLNRNYYYGSREYQYKDIKPRIICEEYMVDENNEGLKDYKFFCFHGEVKVLFVVTERSKNPKLDFFDTNFNHMPYKQAYDNSSKDIQKPKVFEEMLFIAEKLSKELSHARIDLYEINGKIYFGECTLHHFSGMKEFEPKSCDELFGSWIDLSKIK